MKANIGRSVFMSISTSDTFLLPSYIVAVWDWTLLHIAGMSKGFMERLEERNANLPDAGEIAGSGENLLTNLSGSFLRREDAIMDARGHVPQSELSIMDARGENLLGLTNSDALQGVDTVGYRLVREAQLMLGGALLGAGQTAAKRLSEAPGQTALQAGVSAAIAYAFVRLGSSKLTPIRYALPVLTTAMSYSFIADMASNLKEQASVVPDAWKKTWDNAGDMSLEQQKIADTIGPFVFDTMLGTFAGLAGGRIAASGIEKKAILNYMQGKYGDRIKQSVFKIASEPGSDGLRIMGSAFAVDRNTLGTAFHVVQDNPADNWTFINANQKGQARVVAGLPQFDLALLKSEEVSKPVFAQSLPLSRSLSQLPEAGVVVGAPSGKKIEMRPAFFQQGIGTRMTNFRADLGDESGGGLTHSVKGGRSWPGMSGGPAITTNGEVVGVMSTLNPFLNLIGKGTDSAPAPTMHYLIEAFERAKNPSAVMSIKDAATEMHLRESEVLRRIHNGKLPAILVPSAARPAEWDWRVLR